MSVYRTIAVGLIQSKSHSSILPYLPLLTTACSLDQTQIPYRLQAFQQHTPFSCRRDACRPFRHRDRPLPRCSGRLAQCHRRRDRTGVPPVRKGAPPRRGWRPRKNDRRMLSALSQSNQANNVPARSTTRTTGCEKTPRRQVCRLLRPPPRRQQKRLPPPSWRESTLRGSKPPGTPTFSQPNWLLKKLRERNWPTWKQFGVRDTAPTA